MSGAYSKDFILKPEYDPRFQSLMFIHIYSSNPDIIISPKVVKIQVGDLFGSFKVGIPKEITEGIFTLQFFTNEFSYNKKYE